MKKVIIAMSGGVDSSVAAALLQREGFDVIGVFLKLWPTFNSKGAKLVAKKLGMKFYVLDLQKEFKKKVVDYFLKNYKLGLTPNPCVVCNKEIKFKLLFKKMLSLDADYIATGHYARIKTQRGAKLLKAKDRNKDQSYFLWKLNQKILKKALFPIGDYTKTEVRSLARRFKLPVLNIPESQEICFIQTTIHSVKSRKAGVPLSAGQFNRVNDFLRKHLKSKPGRIIDREGKTIGEHQGLWFYTIGQRKGVGISGAKPYYVLDKDFKKNVLVITQNKKDLFKKELMVKNINWISPKQSKGAKLLKIKAKIRYRHEPASAIVYPVRGYEGKKEPQNKQTSNGVQGNRVIFDKPQQAITPGQSVVFYKGQELLGGAAIDYNFYLK